MWAMKDWFFVQEMKRKNTINQVTPYVSGTTGKNTAGSEFGSTCKCVRRNVDNSCMVKTVIFFIISGI
jgi:hypothetical protein